jgi:hypothetical protein
VARDCGVVRLRNRLDLVAHITWHRFDSDGFRPRQARDEQGRGGPRDEGQLGSVAPITLLGHNRRYVVIYYFKQSKVPVDFDREDGVSDKALAGRGKPIPARQGFRVIL